MPSKRRWALNPRKWFGTISNAAHQRDKKSPSNNPIIVLPPAVKVTRTDPSTTIVPRILASRNKTKVTPLLTVEDNNYTNSANTMGSFTQFHLPPFQKRREKTTLLSASSNGFHRPKVVLPTRLEPSIRKNVSSKEELSIDTTRWTTETTVYDISKALISQYRNISKRNSTEKQVQLNVANISDPCFIYCPQDLPNGFIEKTSSPTQSHRSLSSSSSSIDDNDEQDQSSSSGVFTDERTDINERLRTASKDTLSTVEVLSVESIADSQTSLNHFQSRPLAHRYRLPISTFESMDDKLSQLEDEPSLIPSNRTQSAENLQKDTPIVTPVLTKSRQSSAAIAKKIEKRLPATRSPPVALEKAGFVRIANATYRLTTDKDDHLYRRQRQNSIIHYLHHEDSLPPANNEESYATIPRTSSTEQLDNNLQTNLRAIVDDCLRPMVESINEINSRSTKKYPRSKRSQPNIERTQINIEDITDKLLSSVDCSTYSQYQRCY